jgi:AcrR family transcriptional regulator
MPRARFFKLEKERRDAILEAAAEEFAASGFVRTSLNRIIQRSGISKGAMYYYFEDKQDLYVTVIRRAWDRFREGSGLSVPDADTAEGFLEGVESLVERTVEFARQRPVDVALFRGLLAERGEGKQAEVVRELRQESRRWTKGFLKKGQEVGAIRTDVALDLLVELTTTIDETGDHWFASQTEVVSKEALERWVSTVLDLILRLLLPADMLSARCKGRGRG